MTLLSNITSVTVGVGLALCSTASMADTTVSANAGLFNLQFQLIDLNPLDNVTPTFFFSNSASQSTSSLQDGFGADQKFTQDNKTENSLSPLSTGLSSSHSGTWSSSNLFNSINTKGYEAGDGYFVAFSGVSSRFSLSANTALVFTGIISGNASSAKAGDPNYFANAYAVLNIFDANNSNNQTSIIRNWSHINSTGSFENFSLTFTNASTLAIDGKMFAQAESVGYGQAAPVPEPETWAMMLGGLAALGYVARRRQRQAKEANN